MYGRKYKITIYYLPLLNLTICYEIFDISDPLVLNSFQIIEEYTSIFVIKMIILYISKLYFNVTKYLLHRNINWTKPKAD